jgi:hypothetical protein
MTADPAGRAGAPAESMRILYIPPEHSFAAFVECAIIGLDRFAMPGAVS